MIDTWKKFTLGDIGQIVSGGTPSTKNSAYWNGDIPWITPADLSHYTDKYIKNGSRFITKEGLSESSAKLVPAGSVLFSSRAPIGYVVIAKNKICTNQGFKSIVPNLEIINPEYLYYYLIFAKHLVENLASGTTFKEISSSSFAKIIIPLPTLNIQKQIVSKLDALFAEIDASLSEIQQLKKQLELYKQSVLHAAFEALLKNCELSTIEKVSESPQYGYTAKSSLNGTMKLLRTIDISSQNIQWESVPYCKSNPEDISKYKLKSSDVLISRTGVNCGISGFIADDVPEAIFASYLIRFRPKVNHKYFYYFLQTPLYWTYVNQYKAGIAVENLNAAKIKLFPFPLPSKEDQEKLVERFNIIFAENMKINIEINNFEMKLNNLKKSILKQAFEGKLV